MNHFSRVFLVLILGLTFSASFIASTPQIVFAANQSTMASSCPATISYGSKGSLVKQLQQTLNDWGWRDQNGKMLVVDGIFGSKTQFVVKNFQSIYAPPSDGIVGPKTWHALGFC
jgi:peptidoglycan hydrolase-like protein with peptidoglycan-binding domain